MSLGPSFVSAELRLSLHPNKVFLKTFASGVDFLGWVHFPDHRILRTASKKRMFRMLEEEFSPAVIASYEGMLSWGNGRKIRDEILRKTRYNEIRD